MLDAQIWISVVIDACFYGLLGLSFYMTMTGAQYFNFAVGSYAMAAALGASWLVLTHDWPVWLACILAVVASGVLGGVTELAVVRQVQRRTTGGELPSLVAIAAVLFAIQQLAGLFFGYNPVPAQEIFPTSVLHFGSVIVEPTTVPLIGATVLIFLSVSGWMRLTRTGRVLRAVGDSNGVAKILGFPVNRIRLVTFVIGGLVAGLAGLLFAPTSYGVGFQSGLGWTIDGFLVLVIGGTSTVWAPLVGGIILAMFETITPYYFGGSSVSYIVFGLALVFFAFRPQGIFARRIRI